MFEKDTYVVLDIPDEEWVERILQLRRKWDPGRATMPVEITVAGSGGVGPIEPGQDERTVHEALGRLASTTEPISVRLTSLREFPNTSLCYLEPVPPEPLIALHGAIASSGIRFKPSPFPFVPHCTIANVRPDAPGGLTEIEAFSPPSHSVSLSSMSLYSLTRTECRLLQRWPLGRK